MFKKRSSEYQKLAEVKILAAQRRTEIATWLAGEGPRTDEEAAIASQFNGPNADSLSRQAISRHRKTQALLSLSGQGALTASEVATGADRRAKLIKYLGGDKDTKLTR